MTGEARMEQHTTLKTGRGPWSTPPSLLPKHPDSASSPAPDSSWSTPTKVHFCVPQCLCTDTPVNCEFHSILIYLRIVLSALRSLHDDDNILWEHHSRSAQVCCQALIRLACWKLRNTINLTTLKCFGQRIALSGGVVSNAVISVFIVGDRVKWTDILTISGGHHAPLP